MVACDLNAGAEPAPYAAEVTADITLDQLNILRKTFEAELPNPSAQATFDYAWGLVRSPSKSDTETGIRMLQSLKAKGVDKFDREIMYYLAIGYVRLGSYTKAKQQIELMLRIEPGNLQALSLKRHVEKKVRDEGVLGMAIVGGVVATGALLLAKMLSRR